ncbi:MAG: hypothetical protein ACJAVF_003697 [Paraglaciecola sp.]
MFLSPEPPPPPPKAAGWVFLREEFGLIAQTLPSNSPK